MAADHITVVDHESIQDGHTTDWDESEVLRILTAEVNARAIDTVRPTMLTLDQLAGLLPCCAL